MLSLVSPHILVPLLPLGTAPSTLVLGLVLGPRKYIQRFFDMRGIPGPGVNPPETPWPQNPHGFGIREAVEKKSPVSLGRDQTVDLSVTMPACI